MIHPEAEVMQNTIDRAISKLVAEAKAHNGVITSHQVDIIIAKGKEQHKADFKSELWP